MTQAEFDERIAQLRAQIARLQEVKAGRLRMRTVRVKGHWVGRYYVNRHTRQIAGRP